MGVHTSAGARLYIGPVAADTIDSVAEFKALGAYVEVGEIEDMGEVGDTFNIVTFTAMANRRVRKFKGSADAGNMTLSLGRDVTDAGQTALKAALASDFDYAVKIVLNDQPAGSPSHPSTIFIRGKITAFSNNIGNVESITRRQCQIAVNSALYEEDAA